MRNLFKISAYLLLILGLVGCGSSSDSGLSSSLSVETQKSIINEAKDEMRIDFSVKSNYGSDVVVNLQNLDISVTPCKVKQVIFSPSEITLDESVDEKSIHAIVRFKEACTPTSYLLNGTSKLSLDGKTNELIFSSTQQEITPEENQTVTTVPIVSVDRNSSTENNESNESSVDTINYKIKFSLEDEEVMKFNLKDKKSIQVSLIDKDRGDFIPNNKIVSFKIVSKQDNLLKLFDSNTNTVPSGLLSYEKTNNIVIYAQTSTRSGLADIDVEIEYLNANGGLEKISKTYSTMIMSGPPTAFSINDDGVTYNFETKWFEHKYLISATDKYNNTINISPTIYVNAMTDFVKDSNGKPILYGKFGDLKGNLIADKDTDKAHLEVNSSIFTNIDYSRDYAIVFGDIHSYEALGKWDINQDLSSDSTLYFSDTYNGENHNSLGFAVGHNYIEEICDSSYREWHVKIDSTDGKYILDKEGKTTVTIKYPAEYVYGKLGAISVNFLGKNPETDKILKSGEVYFDVWNNVEGLKGDSISIPKGTGTQTIRHYGIIDTGTEDKFILKNSHFSCLVEATDVAELRYIGRNRIITDASQCEGNGENSYIEYSVTALDDKDGSVTFSKCYVDGIPNF